VVGGNDGFNQFTCQADGQFSDGVNEILNNNFFCAGSTANSNLPDSCRAPLSVPVDFGVLVAAETAETF
jgi:hypothetical protein